MTIDTADAQRTASALRLLAAADTWQSGRDHDGDRVWFIPSEREPNLWHVVSSKGCTCADARHRGAGCKHSIAGGLRAAQLRADRRRRRPTRPAPAPERAAALREMLANQ